MTFSDFGYRRRRGKETTVLSGINVSQEKTKNASENQNFKNMVEGKSESLGS